MHIETKDTGCSQLQIYLKNIWKTTKEHFWPWNAANVAEQDVTQNFR